MVKEWERGNFVYKLIFEFYRVELWMYKIEGGR